MEDMEEKFRLCLPFSIYEMKEGSADKIINNIENLESFKEFRDFTDTFNDAFVR